MIRNLCPRQQSVNGDVLTKYSMSVVVHILSNVLLKRKLTATHTQITDILETIQ